MLIGLEMFQPRGGLLGCERLCERKRSMQLPRVHSERDGDLRDSQATWH
jgi:hypothetical protein